MYMVRILIVEDEEFYGQFLKKIIDKKYQCDLAKDGNEAKMFLFRNMYDIILYDLRLPGMFGKELIQYVKKKVDPDMVNIVITGYEEDWPSIEATEEHIFYYLRKGNFTPEDLMKILDNAVMLRQHRQSEATYIKNLIATEKLSSTGKLAVSIAHEINNPLQSMIAINEVIKNKISTHKEAASITHDLQLLERGMKRIHRVIKQLIALHNIDYSLSVSSRLNSIFERVISFIQPIAKEKNTKLTIHNTVKNGSIYVSESQFFHVLINIIMNLLDLKNEQIEIITKKISNYIAIEIKTKRRKSILWKDLETTDKRHSHSLSLDISKSIIQHYNGTIQFQDRDEGESIFIQLPYVSEKTTHEKATFHNSIDT
jgi:signal transduction histidine kinase